MSLIDEARLRQLVGEEVRVAIREEIAHLPAPTEYLSVAEAARVVEVSPATIRGWINEGRLTRRHAGRELRVSRRELEALMAPSAPIREPSPEEHAARFLAGKRDCP